MTECKLMTLLYSRRFVKSGVWREIRF